MSVAFSPDGQLLASGSYDETVRVFQTIRLWDTATGALNENVTVDGVVTDLKFSQDSSYLTTNLGSLDIQSSESGGVYTATGVDNTERRKIIMASSRVSAFLFGD
ncbi:hypothetical protein AAEP93_003343 [Penicillium crustosum]